LIDRFRYESGAILRFVPDDNEDAGHQGTLREFTGAGFGEIVTIKALAEQGLDDALRLANVDVPSTAAAKYVKMRSQALMALIKTLLRQGLDRHYLAKSRARKLA